MAESFVLPGFHDATQNCMFWQIAKSIIHIEANLVSGVSSTNPVIVNIQPFTYGILHMIQLGGDSDGAPFACSPSNLNLWFRLPTYYVTSGAVTSSNVYAQISDTQIKLYSSNSGEYGLASGFLYIIE